VLAFTALAGVAAAIPCGVAPAWHISRLDRYELLKEGARSNAGGVGRQSLRSTLVTGEVALALMLLVGAGLLLRSLAALENVNPGFEPRGVITGYVSLPRARYSAPSDQIAFYRAVLANRPAPAAKTRAEARSPGGVLLSSPAAVGGSSIVAARGARRRRSALVAGRGQRLSRWSLPNRRGVRISDPTRARTVLAFAHKTRRGRSARNARMMQYL
jgi:hypothetical protein